MNNNKKVLFAATVFSHLAAFHKPFIKWFHDQGYEVHAIGNPDHGRRRELESIGVVCYDIPFSRSPFSPNNIKSYKLLKKLLKKQSYSVIHVHTPIAAFIVRYVAMKYSKAKVLYTAHGFHFYKGASWKNWLFFYPIEKLAARWTDCLLVMNKEDYNIGLKMGFKESESLYFVHGVGVDTQDFISNGIDSNNLRDTIGLSDNSLICTCIAELNKNKNHVYLLEIWKCIEKSFPNSNLLLVGDGIERNFLESLIKVNDLKRVKILGFRRDIKEILAISNIITLVSKREGLPRAVMEAMASGKPVVASDIRGHRDLIINGKTGYLIPLNNVKDGVESFIKLMENPSLGMEMGMHGQKIIKNYDISVVLKEVTEIYRRFLSQ